MKTVLWFFEYPTSNGGEKSLLAALPAIQAAGFQPVAHAPPGGRLETELARYKVPLVSASYHDSGGRRLPLAELRRELLQVVKRARPALIHANSLAMSRILGPVAAEARIPSLGHLRDILSLSRQAVADLNHHAGLAAVSCAVRDCHVGQGLDPARTEVIPNGIDLTEFRPQRADGSLKRQWSLPENALLVGCVGQLVMRKGQDVLVQAARLAADSLPNVVYVFAGERYSQKAEAEAYEAGIVRAFSQGVLSGRGFFMGFVESMVPFYAEIDLLVHPARQEPLGRVLLEAAACGKPIVATRVGGTAQVFPPGSRAARLVPPDDPAELALALVELCSGAEGRASLGRSARARAEQSFDIAFRGPQLADFYNRVSRV